MKTKEEILSEETGEEGIYLTKGMIRGSDALEAMQIYADQETQSLREQLKEKDEEIDNLKVNRDQWKDESSRNAKESARLNKINQSINEAVSGNAQAIVARELKLQSQSELIESLAGACQGIENLKDLLTFPDDIKPEHEDEALAVFTALQNVSEALSQYETFKNNQNGK